MTQEIRSTPSSESVEKARYILRLLDNREISDGSPGVICAREILRLSAAPSENTSINGEVRGLRVTGKGSVQYGDAPDQSTDKPSDALTLARMVIRDSETNWPRTYEPETVLALARAVALSAGVSINDDWQQLKVSRALDYLEMAERSNDPRMDIRDAIFHLRESLKAQPVAHSATTSFMPTHRHAEGGLYEVLDTSLQVQVGGKWMKGVRYRNAEGMEFVRDIYTFDARFTLESASPDRGVQPK